MYHSCRLALDILLPIHIVLILPWPGLSGWGLLPDHLGDPTAGLPVGDWVSMVMALSSAWPANVWLLVFLACLRGLSSGFGLLPSFSDDRLLPALPQFLAVHMLSSTSV